MAIERAPRQDPMIPSGQSDQESVPLVLVHANSMEGRPIDQPLSEDRTERPGWVHELRELDLSNTAEIQACVDLWNHPLNRPHLANPPTSVEEVLHEAMKPQHHFLISTNKAGRIIGAGLIEDAPPGQHDHWLRLVAVLPEVQSQREGEGEGTGKNFIKKAIDWAATTLTYYGRRRDKLDASIIMGIAGWKKMLHILRDRYSFKHLMYLRDQVDVVNPETGHPVVDPATGRVKKLTTERLELNLNNWRDWRELPESA